VSTARAGIDPRIRRRRATVQREQGRRRLRVMLVLVSVAVAVVCLYGIARSSLLAVEEITVVGAVQADPDVIRAAAGIEDSEPILFVDLGDAGAAVEAVPWVAGARVTRELAHTIRIEVTERIPVAWFARADGTTALVDGSGRVLGPAAAPPPLPELHGLSETAAPAGARIASPGLAEVSSVLPEELRSRVRAVVRVDEGGDVGATLLLSDGPEVRLGSLDALPAKGSAVLAVLGALGDTRPAYIDVRVPSAPVTG